MKLPEHFPVTCHTDHIGKGSTFVAIKGSVYDGVSYIPQAIERGSSKIVVQEDAHIPEEYVHLMREHAITLIRVDNTRRALAELSAQALDYPARKLTILGVTGTKGKTTTVFFLEHLFKSAGYKTAFLSTERNSILGHTFPTNLTTQLPDYLQVFFKQCIEAGVTHVIMEVAAQGLTLYRTWGIEFSAALFTNFDMEHAEFYATQDDYFNAKCALFEQCKTGSPLIFNTDDERVRELTTRYPACTTYSLQDSSATYYGQSIARADHSVALSISTQKEQYEIHCPSLLGTFNAYNVLAATTLAREYGLDIAAIQQACLSFGSVPGRMERYILSNGATCYIDYAHNPLSYENLLSLLRQLTPHLIVVFGAGGERDHARRPLMGEAAARYADLIVLTSDNPRSENAQDIIDDIMRGIPQTKAVNCILDRTEAISYACKHTTPKSIVALLGKGSEEYQMIGRTKYYYSDKQTIKAFIQIV